MADRRSKHEDWTMRIRILLRSPYQNLFEKYPEEERLLG